MSKIYKNKGKFIDPRYFMDEKLEESDQNKWPKDKTEDAMMARAKAAAERGERIAAGEEDRPPWQEEPSDGIPDVKLDLLDEKDMKTLKDIVTHLNTVAGGSGRGELFAGIMKKLGIDLTSGHPSTAEIDRKYYGDAGHPWGDKIS